MNAQEPPKDDVESSPDLGELREAIESIDRRLLELLEERMDVSERVADAKIRAAVPLRDAPREELVLQRIRRMAADHHLDPHQMEHLFRNIIEMSITHQQSHLDNLATTPLRVAYQGVEGSFSHHTAQRRYARRSGGVLLTGYETFRRAARSVKVGDNDVALLPIENSTAGSINEVYDLLSEGGLTINAETITEVRHCLLGLPEASLDELQLVISHPQALAQCERYLDRLGVQTRADFDTAGAARQIKLANDPTIAAIAGAAAAQAYGLTILEEGIQDQAANSTRFVELAVEATTCPPDLPCKTSLLIATGHRPGDLGDVLTQFARSGVNLTKLESRPVPGETWKYRFYLDIEGHARSSQVQTALEAIEPFTRELTILGTYPAADSADSRPEETAKAETGAP